jgi:hypothetical protein
VAIINFMTGSPNAYISQFRTSSSQLAHLKQPNDWRESQLIDQAMRSVIGLKILRDAEPEAEWVTTTLPGFWGEAGEALAQQRVALAGYRADMETAFWQRTSRGWIQGSLRRSGLEILRTDVEPTSVKIIRDDFLTIDDELPDLARYVPRLAPGSIPEGMPESHWWWTLPSGNPDLDLEDGY